jgi:hypothetical protein
MVLSPHDIVKAELVSQYSLRQGMVICFLGRAHIGRLQQEENPKFHR